MIRPPTTRRSPAHGAKVLGVRLTAAELALVTAAADRAGLAPTTWVRQAAVAQAEAQNAEPPHPGG